MSFAMRGSPQKAAEQAVIFLAARAMDHPQVFPSPTDRRRVQANMATQCPGPWIPTAFGLGPCFSPTQFTWQKPNVAALVARAVDHVLQPCRRGCCQATGQGPAFIGPLLATGQTPREIQAGRRPTFSPEGKPGNRVRNGAATWQQRTKHLRSGIVHDTFDVAPKACPAKRATAAL